ncbi:cytochrome P450 family protein [Melanomma pulvis-pyrius CBS 109.77]|uniref:Cytochrome P450 family protein n=1 Tax=Melanomma pulvis-pyrius CBS 109.77 TaxID=1314802 RepID=A0A6A6WTD3_9PLEO|nr:cytochrome P450 family protein [Melanomma pulvis-pyrius CBS 109.77]
MSAHCNLYKDMRRAWCRGINFANMTEDIRRIFLSVTSLPESYSILSLFCLIATFALVVSFKLYRALATPLRGAQGPWFARFSRLWLLREVYHGTFMRTNVKLHEKYGPIVRIAPNEYSIDDPAAVQIIYGSKGRFTKSTWYDASGFPGKPNGFNDHNIERHAAGRRKVSSAYSMTNLVQLEPFINDCTSILRARLDEFASTAALVDIPRWTQCYAFDVIGEMTLGERFGFLDAGKDIQGIIQTLDSTLFYASRVGIYSFLHPILFWLNMMLNMEGMGFLINFIQDIVTTRMGKPPPDGKDENAPADFITKFQRIREENPEKIDKEDIMASAVANISAGSDTTSISLTSVIFHLCKFPEALARLRNELEGAIRRGEIADSITFKQAQKLPYLQAVIKEGLRIHPATGLILGRVVPKGGATIAGCLFPEGTTVGINAWVAGRNKDVYGDDVEAFRPERWLEDAEVVKRREAYFMTFGSGPRTCLGKNISLLEMSKVIPVLVLEYDFEPEHPDRPCETENVWFVKQKHFRCRVRRRSVKS